MGKDLNQSVVLGQALLEEGYVSTALGIDCIKLPKAAESVTYSTQALLLPKALSSTWLSFVSKHDLELSTILQGAWALLLSRYSAEEKVVFGFQLTVPTSKEFNHHPLPLRIQVAPDAALLPWLQQLQQQWSSLKAYFSVPLAQEHAMPAGSLLESLLLIRKPQQDKLAAYPCPLTVVAEIDIAETEPDLTLQAQYDRHRFDDAAMTRMLGHLQTLLESMIASPYSPLSVLPLLTQVEHHQLLAQGRATEIAYPKDKCLHQLFEQQVEQTPDAIAVTCETHFLTYSQLNQRANQVARSLQQLGVKPDSLVGLYIDRSLEMVVGILAILKAGGAYVPLDPAYPRDRLTHTLSDAGIAIILTQKSLVAALPATITAVCLDAVDEAIVQQSRENPTSAVTAENLVYVIYTSGSTGNPKGVLVTHQNVTRLFAATQPWYCFNQRDVITLFHSYAFDFSVWELWSALLYGGRLVIVPTLITRSPQDFYQLLCQEQVTVLSQTPSAFRQLISVENSVPNQAALALRLVIFGGEALELQSLRPWFERHGDRTPQLVNMYGITETTVHVTYRPLTTADLDRRASVIGRPLPDLQVYVLDQHRQLVPIGVTGELYVGGAGVVRGYLNRPDLTAERFIANPFHANPLQDSGASRLYKTGDLARYLPNGELEYLGRIDHQVKIRGFRIELGEIEAALSKHKAVQECIVLNREDQPGTQRLVAYFVSKPDQYPTVGELRAFLKGILPDYMLPAAYVRMDCLPLTVNGKVDRQVLPAPDRQRPSLEQAFIAPQTSVEKQLASLWGDLLGLDQVGVLDNFFELGGTSLLGVQMMAQMLQLGRELRAVTLYQYPTIRTLAQHLTQTETQQQPLENAQTRAQRQRAAQSSSHRRSVRTQPYE